MSEAESLARVLRIIAKHATACADELAATSGEPPDEAEHLTPEEQLAEAKRQQALRHAQLSGRK